MIVAVGSGLSMVTGYAVATFITKPEDAGAGLRMQNVAQIGGQVIALAVAGHIFQSTAIRNLCVALAGKGFLLVDCMKMDHADRSYATDLLWCPGKRCFELPGCNQSLTFEAGQRKFQAT